MAVFIGALIVLASSKLCDGHGKYISSVYGEVGRGNITHFSMAYHGTILLELTSLDGDCDLYVSQFTIKPSYEPNSYCLQSMTCGLDSVIVPKSFKRPVGIGIFGYPIHTNCKYHLLFFEIDDVLDVFHHDYFSDSLNLSKNEKLVESEDGDSTAGDNEEGKESASGSVDLDSGERDVRKETRDKKKPKKLDPEKDKVKKTRKYYEGESYFWIFFDYLLDCLIDLII